MGAKLNCWEVMAGCDLDKCPCRVFELADGFLGGRAGGRACMFIPNTCCNRNEQSMEVEKVHTCVTCDFFKQMCTEEGGRLNREYFNQYVSYRSL
ncbi:MAG: hypothetical protein L7F77_12845 [Candidatus Magnetominusculus sp. LBB02]|nr:hypothetical protein [Candidatus Magnetominusculus sp. LBB02]